jgi:hypothetical protein
MELVINRAHPSKAGLLAVVNGRIVAGSNARLPRLIRNDGEPISVRVAEPSDNGASEFEEIDLSEASVRVGIGLPDQVPTDGTFTLQVGSDITDPLPYNATAAVVEAALNLLPDIITQGGVTVDSPVEGAYRVTWNDAGAQGSIPIEAQRSGVPRWYPLEDVTGYVGGGATNLDGVTTSTAALGSFYVVVINGIMAVWQLQAGTAATDLDNGILRPVDYDSVTNPVNLVRVAGI